MKTIIKFIWEEVIVGSLITLIIKNPCKKCLVKACCTEVCFDKHNYLRYCDPEGSINFQRITALTIWLGFLALILSIVKVFV